MVNSHEELVHSSFPKPGTQMAGDVVKFPVSGAESDYNRLKGTFRDTPVPKFDSKGDMTGGGKVVPGPGYTN